MTRPQLDGLFCSSQRMPIYKVSMEEGRCGAVFPGNEASIPMLQIKFPPFSAKAVHLSVNLPPADDRIKLLIQGQVEDIPSQEGNLGEGSFLDTRLCQAQRFKAAVDA